MEIRRYFALALKWAWLVILGTVIGGLAAFVVDNNTAPSYRASARLLIDEAPGGGGNEYAQALFEERLAATYVELIGLRPVLEETVSRLNLPFGAEQLRTRLSISAPTDAQIIVISVTDTNPERAALIANGVGDVFTDLNQQRESARYATSIASYEQQLETLQAEISSIETEIFDLGEPDNGEGQAKLSQLETARREAQIRYTEAFNSRESLRVEEARASNNLIPVEPARIPSSPIGPRTATNTMLGAAVGVLIAIGVAFVIEYMDDTIRSPEQVRQAAALTTLGAITRIKGGNGKSRLITFDLPRSPVSEAFRVIRTNLSFAAIDEELRTVLVTSASPGEGKSTISANLAVVMAQTGKSVILIDSDLRRPSQHKIFALPNNQGLTTALLEGEAPFEAHLQKTSVPGLRLLTSGPIPPNPAELLNSQRMNVIIELAQQEADLVVFDTPPALTVADASILAPLMNGCLLIVDAGNTRQPAFKEAVGRMRNSGAHVLGAVINQLQMNRSGYNYYYEHYRYYDYAQSGSRRGGRRGLRWPRWISLGRRS